MFGWFKKKDKSEAQSSTKDSKILGRDFLFEAGEEQFMSKADAISSWKKFIKDDCLERGASKAEASEISKEWADDFKFDIKQRRSGWKETIKEAKYLIKDSPDNLERVAEQEAIIKNAEARLESEDHTSELLFELNCYVNKMSQEEVWDYYEKDFK